MQTFDFLSFGSYKYYNTMRRNHFRHRLVFQVTRMLKNLITYQVPFLSCLRNTKNANLICPFKIPQRRTHLTMLAPRVVCENSRIRIGTHILEIRQASSSPSNNMTRSTTVCFR